MKGFKITLLVLIFSFQSISQTNGFEVVKNLDLFNLIYLNLEKYYVEVPEIGAISKAGIDAMLNELDPYTVYYHEANMEDYRMMTTGQYGGIGALIRKVDDYVIISEPYEGNPAQIAGLESWRQNPFH
jgi:carboxyl-terminal processing protease